MSKQTEQRILDDLEISNTKINKVSHQMDNSIKSSEILDVGTSRHELKTEAREKGLHGSHEINGSIGITSWASYHKLESQANVFGVWCFATYGLNNINQIKPEHVTGFINALVNHDYAKNTVQGYAAGLNKLAHVFDTALGGTRSESWAKAIDDCRSAISTCIAKDTNTRAYADPQAIVSAMPDERLQLCAAMQLDHGLRIADATKINANNISADDTTLRIDNSKNGQTLEIQLKTGEAEQIRSLADERGMIAVGQGEYRAALEKACIATGQEFNGSHGLRHNYAQHRMDDLMSHGTSYETALSKVSDEMGHHRPEITLTYLR